MKWPIWLSRRNIVLTVVALAIAWGMIGVIRELIALQAQREIRPYFFNGDLFEGIKGATGGEKYVGYITDRDIKDDKVTMRFTQAQFTLAPVILDLNNTDHRLLLLDFQDEKKAVALGAQLKLRLLKRSPQGLLFAERLGP